MVELRPRDARTFLKRVRQLLYVGRHPISHGRCHSVVRRSGLSTSRRTPFKYVGEHLALSLNCSQRHAALTTHYELMPRLLCPAYAVALRHGLHIWRMTPGGDVPELSITLEPAKLAPMEGELQLRFSSRADLFVLTFSLAPGHVFGSNERYVLFIGGIQGIIGTREEVREASRANGEISPAAMLILAVQAIAHALGIREIVAVGEQEQISMSYARSRINLDYAHLWQHSGGERIGTHYRLPIHSPQKPLSQVSLSHRSRARRRREAKAAIRRSMEARTTEIFRDLRHIPDLFAAARAGGRGRLWSTEFPVPALQAAHP